MPTPEQTESTLYAAQCKIDNIEGAETELQAEKFAAEAEGYISALREHRLIEHEQFEALASAIKKALSDWHWKMSERKG